MKRSLSNLIDDHKAESLLKAVALQKCI